MPISYFIVFLGYSAAAYVLSLHVGFHSGRRASRWLTVLVICTVLLLHVGALYQGVLRDDGMHLGFINMLSLVAWLMAFPSLLLIGQVSVQRFNVAVLALITIVMGGLALASDWSEPIAITASMGLRIHIVVSLIGYSLLGLAALLAVFVWLQDRLLKTGHPGLLIRFVPPLWTIEKLLFRLIITGFALLTVALASGFLYLDNIFDQHLVHKTVFSCLAWLGFGVLLMGRRYYGWRGKKAVNWTLLAYVSLMISYFGSKFVLEILLSH